MRLAAEPDPDDLITLLNRPRRHYGLARDLRLARDFNAAPFPVEQQPVVTAANAIRLERAVRKRQRTMAASILQCRDLSISRAKQHHGTVEQGTPDGLVLEFPAQRGDIPLIKRERVDGGLGARVGNRNGHGSSPLLSYWCWSKIEHESSALCPRTTWGELVVKSTLRIGQELVPVFGLALKHRRQARTADTLLARAIHRHTRCFQCL